ncbi:MAG: DUF4198 domain-containing protein [Deltaproteobacteria bacterium]|nr:DUF4198 domain-containing protein [Deltaproteobacteria bacterium]
MKTDKLILAFAGLALSIATQAKAHYLWLERDGNGPAKAYFGEYADDRHEKAGGLLDRFTNLRAFLASPKDMLVVEKRSEGFDIAAKGAGDLRAFDDSIAARPDSERGGKTRTIYYAKAGRAETAAKLDFELVPAAANGKDFTLLLRGAPLAKTELTVFAPSKWGKTLSTDDKGRVTLPLPWAGRYVVEVVHFEDKPSGEGDGKYDRTRHITSISFTEPNGMRWVEKRR